MTLFKQWSYFRWRVEITMNTHDLTDAKKQYESWSQTQLNNHIHWFHSGEEFYLHTMYLWKVCILHVNLKRFSLWTYNHAVNNITEQKYKSTTSILCNISETFIIFLPLNKKTNKQKRRLAWFLMYLPIDGFKKLFQCVIHSS